jgi:hypothetical protein
MNLRDVQQARGALGDLAYIFAKVADILSKLSDVVCNQLHGLRQSFVALYQPI